MCLKKKLELLLVIIAVTPSFSVKKVTLELQMSSQSVSQLSVRLSEKPLILSESSLHICHYAYLLISQTPISHHTNQLSIATHHAYQLSCQSAIMSIIHYTYQPSDFKTALQEFLHYLQLLSLLTCLLSEKL